jgi:hypothetical protein
LSDLLPRFIFGADFESFGLEFVDSKFFDPTNGGGADFLFSSGHSGRLFKGIQPETPWCQDKSSGLNSPLATLFVASSVESGPWSVPLELTYKFNDEVTF